MTRAELPAYDLVRCFDAEGALIYVTIVRSTCSPYYFHGRHFPGITSFTREPAARGYKRATKVKNKIINSLKPRLNLLERARVRAAVLNSEPFRNKKLSVE